MDLEALIERPPPGYMVLRRQRGDLEEVSIHPIGFSWGDGPWPLVQIPPTLILPEAFPPPARDHGERSLVVGSNETTQGVPVAGTYNPLGHAGAKRRRGRKRKARNPMGRPLANPFGALAEKYLADIRSYPQPPAETTLYELSRKLARLEALFLEWEKAETIASADPRQIDVRAIRAFLDHMNAKGFTNAYKLKMKQALGKILKYAENLVLEKLEETGMVRISETPPEIHPKSLDWLQESIAKLEALPDALPSGWPVQVVRFALPMYFWTMLRVPELRKSKLSDLDIRTWKMKVSVPKGMGRWAAHNSRIEIVPELRTHVTDFLDSRQRMLDHMGLGPSEMLIPTMKGTAYTGTAWSQMRCRVFRKAAIETDRGDGFRILRPSGGSLLEEMDLPLEVRQALLRHETPATTVRLYSRMKPAKAWAMLERALEARRKVTSDTPATS